MGSEKTNDRFRIQDNLPLFIGLLSVSFVAARLLSIAGDDPETAYAVLQAQGTGAVIIGSLVPTVGLLAAPAAVAAFYYMAKLGPSSPWFLIYFSAGVFLVFVTIETAPILELLLGVGTSLLAVAYWLIQRRFKLKHGRIALASVAICLYATFVLPALILSTNPWLPIQRITIKNGGQVSGYVLSDANDEVEILTKKPIGIIQVPSSRVLNIANCVISNYWTQETIGELAHSFGQTPIAKYGACPPR